MVTGTVAVPPSSATVTSPIVTVGEKFSNTDTSAVEAGHEPDAGTVYIYTPLIFTAGSNKPKLPPVRKLGPDQLPVTSTPVPKRANKSDEASVDSKEIKLFTPATGAISAVT